MSIPFLLHSLSSLALSLSLGAIPPPATSPKPSLPAPEKGSETAIRNAPAVFEDVRHIWTFQDDGTSRRETRIRVRIQHQAAVQGFGQINWGYNAASEKFQLLQLQVKKPGGQCITAGEEAVQDVAPQLPSGGPSYTDYREKHVVVPALSPGDILEFAVAVDVFQPHTPGQFWGAHQFTFRGACLAETLEIRHSASRQVRFKTRPEFKESLSQEGGFTVHRWTHAHVDPAPPEREDALPAYFKRQFREMTKRLETPDIQFTTFQSWAEVGDWYAGLERPQRSLTPALDAKAADLLKGAASGLEKAGAIYGFVAQEFRYVSLSFGQGRYQPHPAAEVFANRYGDCKDKGTLLAAMLTQAGLHAEVALCCGSRKVDPDVPSPAQFDHLIVRALDAGSPLWLDATGQTNPFQSIAPALRGKWALVIRPGGASSLERIPEDTPLPTLQELQATGSVDASGALTLKTHLTLRNDAEANIRALMRNAAPEERNRVLARALSLSGEVVEVQSRHLDTLQAPLELDITTRDASFLDPSKEGRIPVNLPLPKLDYQSVDADEPETEPFELAPALRQRHRLTLTFPKGTQLQAPLPVAQTRAYGQFASSYKVDGERLELDRTMTLSAHRLVPGASRDWMAFTRSVDADHEQAVRAELPASGSPGALHPRPAPSGDAESMYKQACGLQDKGDFPGAVEAFEALTARFPDHPNAWNNLGRCYAHLQLQKDAEQAYRKAIALNAFQPFAYNNLGLLLWDMKRLDEAEAAFRKQIEVSPLDEYAHGNLGELLLQARRNEEALSELERAWQITPEKTQTGISLGEALLRNGKTAQARTHYEQLASKTTSPAVWNNIAYSLCENAGDLRLALRLAEGSLNGLATQLGAATLDNNGMQQFSLTLSCASTLDTLGWVHHRLGNAEMAFGLVATAQALRPSLANIEHLGILLEARGEANRAIKELSKALIHEGPKRPARIEDPAPRIQALLERITGSKPKARAAIERAKTEGYSDRTIRLPLRIKKDATGFVLLETDATGKVKAVHYQSGEPEFGSLRQELLKLTLPLFLPAETPLKRLVRGGQLVSEKLTGEVALQLTDTPVKAMLSNSTRPLPDALVRKLVSDPTHRPRRM